MEEEVEFLNIEEEMVVEECRGQLSEGLLCGVCEKIPVIAKQCMQTGRIICKSCSMGNINNVSPMECPLCTEVKHELIELPIFMKEFIGKIVVKCPFAENGCGIKVQVCDLSEHYNGCAYEMKKCEQCSASVTEASMPEHMAICPKGNMVCIDCGVNILREKGNIHQEECIEYLRRTNKHLKAENTYLKEVNMELRLEEERRGSNVYATASDDRTVALWGTYFDVQGRLRAPREVARVIHTDQSHLVTTDDGGNVIEWDFNTQQAIQTLTGHTPNCHIWGLTQLEREGLVITSSNDKSIRFWDLRSGALQRALSDNETNVLSVFVHSNGRLLSGEGHHNPVVTVWNLNTFTIETQIQGFSGGIWKFEEVNPDQLLVVSEERNNPLHSIDLKEETATPLLPFQDLLLESICKLDDTQVLLGGYGNNRKGGIYIWDVINLQIKHKILGIHANTIMSITKLKGTSNKVASVSWDGSINIIDLSLLSPVMTVKEHNNSYVNDIISIS